MEMGAQARASLVAHEHIASAKRRIVYSATHTARLRDAIATKRRVGVALR